MDNMQLWLSSSTDSINLNDRAEGFYLNPDLEGLTGLPDIRSVNGLNAGYDGGWTATQLWAARLITIRGVIAINDKAAVETKRKALAKILSQGKDEDLELKFVSEAGNTYTTTVRTSYCTMALQRVFWRQEYQIQLRANDPLIYDDGGSELIAILRVMAGEGGFEIPFDIPFDIGGTVTPTSIDVGDEATYPLIRLKGDLHNPTIINMTTNQRMQVLADIITTVEWHDYTTTYTTDGFAQISNGLDGAPLSLTHLYGNATQETLSGKNLWGGFENEKTATILGVRFTNYADGTIKGNGTAAGGRAYSMDSSTARNNGRILTLPAGTYNLSGGTNTMMVALINSTGQQLYITTPSSHEVSFTLSEQTDCFVRAQVEQDSTVSNETIYPMLVQGATAGDYEPYTGSTPTQLVPSPNPDYPQDVNVVSGAQTVRIVGKNLWGGLGGSYGRSAGDIAFQTNSDGTITASGIASSTVYSCNNSLASRNNIYTTLKAGTYYLSTESTPPTGVSVRIGKLSDGTTFAESPHSFTLAEDTDVYISLRVASGTNISNGITVKPMVERNNQATTYEPYKEQSYVLPFGDTYLAKIGTYQDYIWNDGGTWKIHKEVGKVVLDGSAGSYNSGANWCYMGFQALGIPAGVADGGVMSDYFTMDTYNHMGSNITINGLIATSATHIVIRNTACTDATSYRTWLASNNTTVYYALATPTDTEITDSELIEQLNHIYSLYGGVNNIMLIPSAGAQGEMTVSYATTVDRDYHEVVIDCQARTVTQDGRNLYPALADGSEFIRLLPGENKLYLTSEVESDDGTAEVKFKKGNISI